MTAAPKKKGPALQRQPQRDSNARQSARSNSRGQARKSQLLSAVDSRTKAIKAAVKCEIEQASVHRTSRAREAELVRICRTTFSHDQRMKKAMLANWLTAEEAEKYLDTRDAHARLSGMRAASVPLVDKWVKTFTATGSMRCVKAYRLASRGAA